IPRGTATPRRSLFSLYFQFGFEAGAVAIDRGHGQCAAAELVAQETVASGDVAIDLYAVPVLRVADIVDRHVVVLAPEERHGIERSSLAEHAVRRGLTLAFGDHPVLDADVLFRVPVGPARNVAGGVDARNAGLQ